MEHIYTEKCYIEYIYNKNIFVDYLKFKFNWEFCILSGHSTGKNRTHEVLKKKLVTK